MSLSVQQAQIFHLPDVGEGLTEAEIVSWQVSVGDQVEVNQVLVEIETAKSIVELPSPFAGSVVALLAQVGEVVPVGAGIIEIASGEAHSGGTEVDAAAAAAADPGESPTGGSPSDGSHTGESAESREAAAGHEQETPKLLVGYGASDTQRSRRQRRFATPAQAATPIATPAQATAPAAAITTGRARAKPPVRGLAKQLGVDLKTVLATGPQGTVSREDVRRADVRRTDASSTAQPPAPGHVGTAAHSTESAEVADLGVGRALPFTGIPTRIPVKGIRKATAAAMVASAFTAPHVTEFLTVDVTASLELLAEVQQRSEFREIKLTPLTIVASAYLRALARTPMAVAHWDDAAQEIELPGTINLGIAAATDRGLIVPHIASAERLSLAELATAIHTLAHTAREGKTPQSALSGGSTTITNIGVFGIDTGTPILNPGETSILAVGAIQRRPWVVGSGDTERIEARSVLQLALSFDHRVLDGAEGSRLLADTAAILRNPGLALL